MKLLQDLFADGRIVDLILLLVVIEAATLLLMRARTGHGVPAAQLLTNLGAGASLLLALRSALAGDPWTATASWLLLGLIAHLADLAVRWR